MTQKPAVDKKQAAIIAEVKMIFKLVALTKSQNEKLLTGMFRVFEVI